MSAVKKRAASVIIDYLRHCFKKNSNAINLETDIYDLGVGGLDINLLEHFLRQKGFQVRSGMFSGMRKVRQIVDAVEKTFVPKEQKPQKLEAEASMNIGEKSVSGALAWMLTDLLNTGEKIFHGVVCSIPIAEGHDELIAAIDQKIASLPQGSRIIEILQEAKDSVLEQKAEAEARKAKKTNQVTDADKVVELVKVMDDMAHAVRVLAQDVAFSEKMQPFIDAAARIKGAATKKEMQQIMRMLSDSV